MKATFVLKGGDGSGNFGHAGRPGKIGGSAAGGSGGKYVGDKLTGDRYTDTLITSLDDVLGYAAENGIKHTSGSSIVSSRDKTFYHPDKAVMSKFREYVANSAAYAPTKVAVHTRGPNMGTVQSYGVSIKVDTLKAKASAFKKD